MRAHLRFIAWYFLAGFLGTAVYFAGAHLVDDHQALHILAQREGARIAAEAKH